MTDTGHFYLLDGPKSYHAVTAEWVPVAEGEGLLVLRLTRSAAGAEIKDVYHLQEQTPDLGGRGFLLLKTTDADGAEPYEVRVGRVTRCTCTGTQTRRVVRCKHILAVEKLISEGVL